MQEGREVAHRVKARQTEGGEEALLAVGPDTGSCVTLARYLIQGRSQPSYLSVHHTKYLPLVFFLVLLLPCSGPVTSAFKISFQWICSKVRI